MEREGENSQDRMAWTCGEGNSKILVFFVSNHGNTMASKICALQKLANFGAIGLSFKDSRKNALI